MTLILWRKSSWMPAYFDIFWTQEQNDLQDHFTRVRNYRGKH